MLRRTSCTHKMELRSSKSSSSIVIFLLFSISILSFPPSAGAQQPATDPVEVEALKVFANKLGISRLWDFSVDPCSGLKGWDNLKGADTFQASSGVECACNTTCQVTKIAIISQRAEGEIAPEIGNFSSLTNLNLQANLIKGRIPDELGSLSQLTDLTVASNLLTGSIPTSIGNLTRLNSMSIALNNLTGSLPKELGNLKSLAKLYMDSNGLGGEIPPEFGNLQSLQILNMFDNNFNGKIPGFLGSMSSLKEIKMYGNKFEGPIPSSLGNLQNLETLEIGDIPSGGVVPPNFNLLKNLKQLSLRNCELSGSMPELGNLTSLRYLDLSFNNLTGQISSGLPSSLDTLLLGSNHLTGALPPQLGSLTNLKRLDVSFNNLSGPLPTWLNNNNLQRNIIWNRFTVDRREGPNSAAMKCLEERSDCSKVAGGKNFQFGINCGGQEVVSNNGTPFSNDTEALGEATYYSDSWAVSSSGYVDSFKTNPSLFSAIEGTTGADTLLYQNARTSPTSLRYFGLGMPNGSYTLQLHFSELVIGSGTDGTGIGRRFFDVYIQGSRMLRDFNIKGEANGSLKALKKTFRVNVSDGVLEVHLLWRGKGTCCAPFKSYGPMISAIEVHPDFDTSGFETKSNGSKGVKIGVGVCVPLLAIIMLACFLLWKRRNKKRAGYQDDEDEDLKSLEGKPDLYSYNDIRTATGGFSDKLGQGGFGTVYKGVLSDGTVVAVKQLFGKSQQGTREFMNEVRVISAVQHRNLVKLHGCCIEGDHRILIFEFLENNSLHRALLSSKGPKLHLDWPTRFNICLGVARGITYLHEDSLPRIVHRDIKASNVLLDKNLNPKIADFGLAKLFEDHQSHISTRVAGTIGYLAPEYAMRGQLTEKADVYSFGVLTLEIVSGRENLDMSLDYEMVYLLEWAWHLYEKNQLLELLDKEADHVDEEQVARVIHVALLCSQAVASSRPAMSSVVAMLTGSAPVDVSLLRPGYFAALEGGFAAKLRSAEVPSSSSSGAGSRMTTSSATTMSSATTSNSTSLSLLGPR